MHLVEASHPRQLRRTDRCSLGLAQRGATDDPAIGGGAGDCGGRTALSGAAGLAGAARLRGGRRGRAARRRRPRRHACSLGSGCGGPKQPGSPRRRLRESGQVPSTTLRLDSVRSRTGCGGISATDPRRRSRPNHREGSTACTCRNSRCAVSALPGRTHDGAATRHLVHSGVPEPFGPSHYPLESC